MRNLFALMLASSLGACFAQTPSAPAPVVSPMLHDQGGALMQNEHDCNAGGGGTLGGVAIVGLFVLRPRRKSAPRKP